MEQKQIDELKEQLSEYGKIEVLRASKHIATILITGCELDKLSIYNDLTSIILNKLNGEYPTIEVLKNDSNFFLMVLK